MKKILLIMITIIIFGLSGCRSNEEPPVDIDYRQSMRDFVKGINIYSKNINKDFIIIAQNGHNLITEDGTPTGALAKEYIFAIDGLGREGLFYGYDKNNLATKPKEQNDMLAFMDIAKAEGKEVLTIDYCNTLSFMDNSYELNNTRGYISFAADSRELDNIPSYPKIPYNVNNSNITKLTEVKNFLYLINPSLFSSKEAFLGTIRNTNYDLLIIDLFYSDNYVLTSDEIKSLQVKLNGGTRLVVAYMSIGEAEDYRYYWNDSWEKSAPAWLEAENSNWPGDYKVRYWLKEWQDIIYGNDNSYLKMILDAGFDGVYLDIIDGFEYFEEQYE